MLERAVEADVLPAGRHFGLGALPYFPLANGLLIGQVRCGQVAPQGSRLASTPGYVTDEKPYRVDALIGWTEGQGRGNAA